VLLPGLLTLLGLLAAFLPAQLRLADPPDWVPLLLLLGGAVWAFVVWRKRRGRKRALAFGAQALVFAAMAYWMLVFSAYGEPSKAPRVGDTAPYISATRVRDGARFEVTAERGEQVLLVFFRGEW